MTCSNSFCHLEPPYNFRIPLTGRNVNFQHDITGNKPHILVLNKKDLVFNLDKKVKKETDYLQEDIKEKILKHEQNLSDVIFTNCKNVRCEGLQSVLPTAVKLIKVTNFQKIVV